jgi:hypothetical protein
MRLFPIWIIACLFLVSNAFALQEVAGPLVIPVPVGGSNSTRWGLINDGNETITVNLSAQGDAAKYLSFPATVDLMPKKLVYTNVTANIPAGYGSSLGRNLTGYLYALQEGQPGQVQINVQMMKSVTITVTGQTSTEQQTAGQAVTGQATGQNAENNQTSAITGLATSISGDFLVIFLIIIVILLLIVIIMLVRSKPKAETHSGYKYVRK